MSGRYRQLIERLYSSRRLGVRFELERVRACLDRLGAPDRRYPIGQVAGTNGKGSTATFAAAMLAAGGHRVGLYTSPHLHRLGERMRIDGASVSDELLVSAGEAVLAAGGGELTFFEQITCMGLWSFAEQEVDVAVLEVGLGGRLDATSAAAVDAAAVTGVDLDHRDVLGDDLSAIAREKAAIFRAGRPAIVGRSGSEEGRAMLLAEAQRRGAHPITAVGAAERARLPAELGIPGAVQARNAAAAVALVDALGAGAPSLAVTDASIAAGAASARLAGRLERLGGEPPVLVDGAHNPAAMAALVAELGSETRPIVALFGCSGDKDLAAMLTALAPIVAAVVAVAVGDRGTPAAAIAAAARARGIAEVRTASGVAGALAQARDVAGPGGMVVATGSLFVAAEVRAAVLGVVGDERVLRDPLGKVASGDAEA